MPEDGGVEPWGGPDVSDATLIIGTLFEINARIREGAEDVVAIRRLLDDEEEDGEEEEEPGSQP